MSILARTLKLDAHTSIATIMQLTDTSTLYYLDGHYKRQATPHSHMVRIHQSSVSHIGGQYTLHSSAYDRQGIYLWNYVCCRSGCGLSTQEHAVIMMGSLTVMLQLLL